MPVTVTEVRYALPPRGRLLGLMVGALLISLTPGCGSSKDGSGDLTGKGPAPRSLRLATGIPKPGFAAGISDDGWFEQTATILLAGGPRQQLTLQAEVLPLDGQHLEVRIDQKVVYSKDVPAGPVAVRVRVPPSTANRRVDIGFTGVVALRAPDTRKAAARLIFIGVGPLSVAPSGLLTATDLGDPGADVHGIYADGWVTKNAALTLAGGPEGELILKAEVPPQSGQRVRIVVNGDLLLEQAVDPGTLVLRLPLVASEKPRRIGLQFTRTIKLQAPDTRRASLLLRSIVVGRALPAPRGVRIPSALARAGLDPTGVATDGWAQPTSTFRLAGGSPSDLAIRALVPTASGQTLEVLVDGVSLVTVPAPRGPLSLRLPIGPSASDRTVELRFSQTVTLPSPDGRTVSALLRFVGLGEQRFAPTSTQFPAAIRHQSIQSTGIARDGWVERDASIVLRGGAATVLTVTAEAPRVPGQRVAVVVNGQVVAEQKVVPGRATISIPLEASIGNRLVVLRFSRTVSLPAPDRRAVSVLLRAVTLTKPG